MGWSWSSRARRTSRRHRRRARAGVEPLERRFAPAIIAGFGAESIPDGGLAPPVWFADPATTQDAFGPSPTPVAAAFLQAASFVGLNDAEIDAALEWVVLLVPGADVGSAATAAGATHSRPTGILADAHVWTFPEATGDARGRKLNTVARPQGVVAAYPLIAREHAKRLAPNDPLFADQWHLLNTGQGGGTAGEDANVTGVWDAYLGTGTLIAIVDDGLQHAHPDLTARYVAAASYDFNGNDPDPTPVGDDAHGTAAAGVSAASGNNSLGVSGVAPGASLAGLRLLGAATNDWQEAAALTHALADIDIYNNSWGPFDDARRLEAPGPLTTAALRNGVTNGRDGLGSIYVWSAGNGLAANDNVNYDGYANSRYTIAVTAIDNFGRQSWYAEPGAPILVAAHSSGGSLGITTTDIVGPAGYNGAGSWVGDYTSTFGGTSSAAPLVSGVVGLMLEANPSLTWRDVQHVLVDSARRNDPSDVEWIQNGSGRWVNHKYGYGAVDAAAAVALAETWVSVLPETQASSGLRVVNQNIPDNNATGISSTFTMSTDLVTEWVEVRFTATHSYRGDLEVVLTSPSGTQSVLAERRGDSGDNYSNWTFTSARHWGESSAGDWVLTVRDRAAVDLGFWNSWSLDVYGTPPIPVGPPTVTISSDAGGPVAGGDATTVTFAVSKPVIGFDIGDIQVTGGTLSGFAGSGLTYTALFTPAAGFEGFATIAVPAGGFVDADGNGNQAASFVISVDASSPTVLIGSAAGEVLGSGDSAAISFTFSEPPTNFDLTSVIVTGGTLSELTGSGLSYAATFRPAANFGGTATIFVAANSFTDVAGNANVASNTALLTVDTARPTVTITRPGAGAVTGETIFSFVVSEPVSGFTAADITVTGGTLSGFAGAGTLYTATFAPFSGSQGNGSIRVAAGAFFDAAGNVNQAATASFLIDTAPPTLQIARGGGGQVGGGGWETITFTISESVVTFNASSVTVTGGVISGFSGSGRNYSAVFVPSPGLEGTAAISVGAGAFTDAVGNFNLAAGPLLIPVDTIAPRVEIRRLGTGPLGLSGSEEIVFTVTEPVTTLTSAAVIVTGGTIVGFTGGGATYSAVFLPAPGFNGTASISVPAGSFADAAGNQNQGVAGLEIPVDALAPRIIGFRASRSGGTLGIGESVIIEADLSEPVTANGNLVIQLNSGGQVTLVVDPSGLVASGVYVAQAGDRADLLEATAVSLEGVILDAVGNPLLTALPPLSEGLAARHAIAVDARVRFRDIGNFGTNPWLVRDVGNRYRTIPIRFTTPVSGLSVSALTLSVDGRPVPLRGARIQGSGSNYVLRAPVSRVNPVGIYKLTAVPGRIRATANGASVADEVSLFWGYKRSVGMVPDAPAWVDAERIVRAGRRTSVVINWQQPDGRGGGSAIRYVVQYRVAGTSRWLAVRSQIPGWATSTEISGVNPGRSYEFRVAAVNAAGQGSFASSGIVNLLMLAGRQNLTAVTGRRV